MAQGDDAAIETPLWLASYPDGALRQGPRGDRKVRRLPADAWFCNELDVVGGAGIASQALRSLGGGFDAGRIAQRPMPRVACLVRVAGAHCTHHQGPLTRWSRECQFLRSFYDSPLDAHSVRIIDV